VKKAKKEKTQTFDVNFRLVAAGSVKVKAKSQEEAENKVHEFMDTKDLVKKADIGDADVEII
jgi:hypothetical protein